MLDSKQAVKKEKFIEFMMKLDVVTKTQINAVITMLDDFDSDYVAWFKQWYSRSEHFEKEHHEICSFLRTDEFFKVFESFKGILNPKVFFIWLVLYKFYGSKQK